MKTGGLLFILSLLLFFSCRKDSFITSGDARLTLTDSLKFDTVFTSSGSVTKSFKIINGNKQKLRISSVKLMGGTASAFKMNVDGVSTTEAQNLELEANDSLYVFVQVNVNPASGNLPFIISDSIEVKFNGNTRKVQLEAWGQNAHFLRAHEITGTETWNNDLPYVVLDYLYVAENARLTINKGCRLYMHANAPVIVDGTMLVNGLKDTIDRVYFQGDRLDLPYRDYPAGWPGIYFRGPSKDNVLTYAVIKNAYQAIGVENPSVNTNPKLTINESVIDNAYDAGLVAVNAGIRARNCLISNCGKNIQITKGGDYRFTHCTVASISNSYVQHKEPVLSVSNTDGSTTAALSAVFTNCIFWGQGGLAETEVVVNKTGTTPFTVNFDHGLWKTNGTPANVTSNNMLTSEPSFDSMNVMDKYYSFRLKEGSPGINAGVNAGVTIDLDGKPRPVGLPDAGCFERQ